MRRAELFSIIILSAVIAGCGGGSRHSTTDFITVDVTAGYPQKDLILQDFMDVEYIPLASAEGFINQGVVKAIGDDILLVTNRIMDGDIFVFTRTGKGVRKINRLGRSGEEYSQITEIVLDEDNNEMFIIDYPARKVVYDLYGNFKRSLRFTDTARFYLTLPYDGDWVLTRPSSDTVYSFHPDGKITYLIVRTPSIHTTDPEVFLFPTVITERYYFMQTIKKEFDLEKMKGFPTTDLVYDKQEEAIFRFTVCNDDFLSKKQVAFGTKPVSHEIAKCQSLEALDLVDAYEKGELKGPLKDIAARLDKESNPVIMLIKHKETK